MTHDEFRDKVRGVVLEALDAVALDVTDDSKAGGWRDEDLGALFKVVDAQAQTIAKRLHLELTDD